jgi:glycerophosphoryl diester phosphodiesterase
MSSNENALREVREYAPNLRICLGCGEKIGAVELVNKAIDLGADKLQFYRPAVEPTKEAVELAHKNGIRCNLCEADIAEEAKGYFDMGIDTVMTNDFLNIYNATKDYLGKK